MGFLLIIIIIIIIIHKLLYSPIVLEWIGPVNYTRPQDLSGEMGQDEIS